MACGRVNHYFWEVGAEQAQLIDDVLCLRYNSVVIVHNQYTLGKISRSIIVHPLPGHPQIIIYCGVSWNASCQPKSVLQCNYGCSAILWNINLDHVQLCNHTTVLSCRYCEHSQVVNMGAFPLSTIHPTWRELGMSFISDPYKGHSSAQIPAPWRRRPVLIGDREQMGRGLCSLPKCISVPRHTSLRHLTTQSVHWSSRC